MSRSLSFERSSRWDEAAGSEVPDAGARATTDRHERAAEGVNLLGYFRGQFGLAESARAYAAALLRAGYPVALRDADIDVPHGMNDRSMEPWLGRELPYGSTLVFVNPDHFESALDQADVAARDGRYVIGFWFWELAKVPIEWLPAIARVDEIMVATDFVAEAFRAITDKPVTKVGFPLFEIEYSQLQRADFGMPANAFSFLCTFDFNSSIERKNPLAVIRAFRQAFAEDRRDVFLMVKSSNGHRNPAALRQLLEAIGGDTRIALKDDIIDTRHLRALQRCSDAYVSLHRAEGLGLGMAESMKLGKPVIATGWSGNMEFMTEENSLLVDSRLIAVKPGEYPLAEGLQWAEPDIAHAASLMRRVADDKALAERIGRRAMADVSRTLSPDRTARSLTDRLSGLSAKH
ncbi:glycosyltransferase family 4 protein [Lysobacter capsici]|nr:glycosyltransferase family 4 protein [Lysobacter capsici]